jgi:multidrug efflux pump subunit AcrA (membrane-fusion protein)
MKRCFRNDLLLLLAAPLSLVLGGCGAKGSNLPTTEVTRGDLVQRVTVSGMVVPRRKAVIAPPYAGYIEKIFVEVGQKVRAGDPLLSITQVIQQNGNTAFPLRAPFSGTVVQKAKSEGEYVEPSKDSLLVRVDDLGTLFVEADVPELEIPKIRLGQEVFVKAASLGKTLSRGVIRQIALASKDRRDAGRGNIEFPIKIEITETTPGLRPGMSTIVDILAEKRNQVLTLRHEFVKRAGDAYSVTLESGEVRPIEVGLQNEEAFEIVSGLKEGDKVRRVEFMSQGGMIPPPEGRGKRSKAKNSGGGGHP